MTRFPRRLLLVAFGVTFTAGAMRQTQAPPTGEVLEALTAEVASQLRCPVCRQLSVQESEAELSKEVKGVIRERLAAGQSPEEVKAYFVSKYGEWILLAPPKRGFTLLVWVLPLVALLGGAVGLALVFRKWIGRDGEKNFIRASASLHPRGDIVHPEEEESPDARSPR